MRLNSSKYPAFIPSVAIISSVATGISLGALAVGFGFGVGYSKLLPRLKPVMQEQKDFIWALVSGTAGVALTTAAGGTYTLLRSSILHTARNIADVEITPETEMLIEEFGYSLHRLEEAIDNNDKITPEARKEANEILVNMGQVLKEFKTRKKASEEIFGWLNKENFKYSKQIQVKALNEALASAIAPITDEQLECFKRDIKNCINWIRWSINERNPYPIDLSNRGDYLSAFDKKIPGGLSLYEPSLECIKLLMVSGNKSGNGLVKARIINDTVDELINRLKLASNNQNRDLDFQASDYTQNSACQI